MTLTDHSTVNGGARSELGYWELGVGPGQPHLVRAEALPGGVFSVGGPAGGARPLLTIAHLSDLHLCDTQSPARGEFLDRWSDPDSPLREALGIIGSYRAQDCLTVPVGVAMVDAVNRVAAGPVGGAPVDAAIVTGDVIDSAQANELGWYLTLLDGGTIVPDSGSASRYEGVADLDFWHEAFWHPDAAVHADGTARRDRPGALFGFPLAPGLLDAARRPFHSPGLSVPWLAVHGNHDQLVQGSILPLGPFAQAPLADRKAVDVPGHWSLEQIAQFCGAADSTEQISLDRWGEMITRAITPDPARRIITRGEFVAAHFAGPPVRSDTDSGRLIPATRITATTTAG